MEDILQLLHHCKCGLWRIPWGCCMDACKPLLRRRPCQLLRLLLLGLGLLLAHHGILWGCCMDACNHLLRRRPASAPVRVVAGAPVPCLLRLLLLLLGLLLANIHHLERLLPALICCCTIPLNIPLMLV